MRIVFDISTSWAWRHHAVGIVRTEKELLRRFLNALKMGSLKENDGRSAAINTAIVFCRFVKKRKHYVRVSEEDAAKTLSKDWIIHASDLNTVNDRKSPAVRQKGRLRNRLDRWKSPASSILSMFKDQFILEPPFGFNQNDLYVSVGNDWFHNDYQILREHKKTAGFKCVLSIHDLIPVLYPHLTTVQTEQRFRQHVINLCRTADSILAVSDCTSKDLRSFIDNEQLGTRVPIHTVLLGDDVHGEVLEPVDVLKATDFFMYVSTIEARKNHAVLLRAWELLYPCPELQGTKLIIVGKPGWGTTDLIAELRRNPYLNNRTIISSNLSDAQLKWLYEQTKFTVFPSIYEGWGLAAAESLRLGKAVVISNAPGLREATQNLMPVVKSHDIEGWSSVIKQLFLDHNYRHSLEQRARLEYKPRSWDAYYQGIRRVIEITNPDRDVAATLCSDQN